MLQGRKYGLMMLVMAPIGAAITILLGVVAGGIIGGLVALIATGTAPPIMVTGLYLVLVPGPDARLNHDFAEWFEEQPKEHRVRIFAAAGVGMAISALALVLAFTIAYERFSEILDLV